MKQRDAGKGSIAMVLVVVSSVNFSNSAEAQTSTYRGIAHTSRTTPAAERIRRDANSINCHALGHLETRYGVSWPQSHRYQTVCYHGRLSKGSATRH